MEITRSASVELSAATTKTLQLNQNRKTSARETCLARHPVDSQLHRHRSLRCAWRAYHIHG
jgi:hypothetical protein